MEKFIKKNPMTVAFAIGGAILVKLIFSGFWPLVIGLIVGAIVGGIIDNKRK